VGHTRLGLLPKTRKWRELVKQIAGPRLAGNVVATAAFYIDAIAAQTLDASRNLDNVAHDSGVRYTFYLLTQVALAFTPDSAWVNCEDSRGNPTSQRKTKNRSGSCM